MQISSKFASLIDSIPHINVSEIEDVYPATEYQRISLSIDQFRAPSCYHLHLPADSDIARFKETWKLVTNMTPMLRTGFTLFQEQLLALVYKPNVGREAQWIESISVETDTKGFSFESFGSGVPIVVNVIGSVHGGYVVRLCIHRAVCDAAAAKFVVRLLHSVHTEQHAPSVAFNFADAIKSVDSPSHLTASAVADSLESAWPRAKSYAKNSARSISTSILRTARTKFAADVVPVLRTALAAVMFLHSGLHTQAFIETTSSRPSLSPELQAVVGPCLTSALVVFNVDTSQSLSDVWGGKVGNDSAVQIFSLVNRKDLPAIQLFIRSEFDGFEDVDITPWKLEEDSTGSVCPIDIDVSASPEGLTDVQIKYDPTLFREVVNINAFADHFISALETLHNSPSLSMMDVFRALGDVHGERALALGIPKNNRSEEEQGPSMLLAHERFDIHANTTPSAIALDYEGTSSMTYSELAERSTALASELRAKGVNQDVMVPILFDVSFEMIIALLAIMKAGGAYVPLAPDHPQARWQRIIETTNAKLLICGPDFDVVKTQKIFPSLTVIPYSHRSFAGSSSTPSSFISNVNQNDLAYVFFTSGSTGTPKGVAVEHRNLCAFLNTGKGNAMAAPGMRKLLFASYTFDISVGDIFSTLTSGGTLGLVRREALLADLPHWLDVMKPTHVGVTPSIARYLPIEGFPHLRYILMNGETLPVELALRLSKTREVHNIMGPTEATIDATEFIVAESSQGGSPFGERVPIGYPIGQNRIYILRPGTLEPAVVGETGEICIGGPQVARGYIGDAGLSKSKFVPDPFSEKPGYMFRSADLGRWNPHGQLDHLGRIDGQVKLRGLRIETGEIESVVHQSVPDIHAVHADVIHLGEEQLMVAVFILASLKGKSDEKWIIPSSNDEVSNAIDLAKAACDTHLPLYMKPTVWLCVTHFPTTTSGKTDRAALLQKVKDHLSSTSISTDKVVRRPNTPSEESLARIVADVLAIPNEDVDLDASLVALGVNSIQAMVLTAKFRDQGFDANILRVLDDRITLGDLASVPIVNRAKVHGERERSVYTPFALAPPGWQDAAKHLDIDIQDAEDVHPVDVVARDWVKLALDHEGRGLLMQFKYNLSGSLDADRFIWSWEQLRRREPILRTVFIDVDLNAEQIEKVKNGVPYAESLGLTAAVLRPDVKGRGPFLDTVTAANAEEAEAIINKMFEGHGLELGVVPIRNLLVYNAQDQTWIFASSRHHVLHDFRSLGMQSEELSELYHKGEAAIPALEAKRSVKTSFGAFMQAVHSPERLASGRAFWKEYLSEITLPVWPPISEVPLTFYKDFNAYGVNVTPWPGSLASVAKKLGVTKGALVRAAYAIALAEKEKRDKIGIYEVVDGLGGLQMDPWGFCTHYQYTKVNTSPPPNSQSEFDRCAAVARDCHRSFIETLPHRASGCDMAAEVVGAHCTEPGQHFASGLLNMIDMTGPQTSVQSSAEDAESFSLLQQFATTEQASFVGVDLPLNVVVRIMDNVAVFICPYDLSMITKEEMDGFVQRHVDVLEVLKGVLG